MSWSIERYGYTWRRNDDPFWSGAETWEVSWPTGVPFEQRTKRKRHTCPDWVWTEWVAYQLREGEDG